MFLRRRKINILLVFTSQSYFKVPETVRLNAIHYFTKKILIKKELQQIVSDHSTDVGFKDFMELNKNYTRKLYSFLVGNTLSSSDKP